MKRLPEGLAVEARPGIRGPLHRSQFAAGIMNPPALEQPVGDEPVALLLGIELQVSEGGLATGLAVVVENLVLEDADQPALLRAATGETLPALKRGEKGFLHHVLGPGRVPQTDKRELDRKSVV